MHILMKTNRSKEAQECLRIRKSLAALKILRATENSCHSAYNATDKQGSIPSIGNDRKILLLAPSRERAAATKTHVSKTIRTNLILEK